VRATASSGRITVTASADGIPPATLTLALAPIEKEDPNIAAPALGPRSF